MAAKSFNVILRPGVAQATLPDHRKMVPGVTYTVDQDTFRRISTGALEKVILVSEVNFTAPTVWGSDNNLSIVNSQTLLTTSSTTATLPQVSGVAFQGFSGEFFNTQPGNTVRGSQEGDRYMFVGNGSSADAIAVGDVLVWSDEANRLVTNQRPTLSGVNVDTNVGNFAGIAISAIPASNFGWIQIEGECDACSVSSAITAGQPLGVDTVNAGRATLAGSLAVLSTASATYTLTTSTATAGTFTLAWNGVSTAAIPYNAAASVIQSALTAVTPSGIGATVAVTGSGPFTITLTGSTIDLTLNSTGITGTVTLVVATGNTQTLSISSSVTGGVIGIVYGNYVSGDIPWNADAALVLSFLQEIPEFPTGVSVTGGPLPGTISVVFPTTDTVFLGAVVVDGLSYGEFGPTFGTALTSSSSTVEVLIRSSKVKVPYSRFYNKN